MNDWDKSQDELIAELVELRQCREAEAVQLTSLLHSEQLMRLHVEQTPLAVIHWDLDLRVSAWNPAAERIFEYSHQEAIGQHFSFIVRPDERAQLDQIWAALRGQKGGERSTNENLTKSGQLIWCEWYNTPLVTAGGQVVGFASLVMDISEQRRTDAALRKSERRLATVLSNLPGAVFRCRADDNWTIEFLSAGYRALTGYEPAELIGKSGSHHSEIIHPEDRLQELDALRAAVAERRHYQVEYRLRTAQGQVKWVWEQGTGVFSETGELEAIEGFTTDISGRKLAEAALQRAHHELELRVLERTASLEEANANLQREIEERWRTMEALRQSEAKYRALIESSPDAIAMIDLQGKILFASQRAAEQHGVEHPEDLIGHEAIEFVAPSDRTRFLINAARLAEEGVLRESEYKGLRRDGREFHAEISSSVIRDANGYPEALMGIYRDISERKRNEQKLKRERRAYHRMMLAGDHERRLITYEIHDGAAQHLAAAVLNLNSLALHPANRSVVEDKVFRDALASLQNASAELRRIMNRLRTPVLDKFGLVDAIAEVAAQMSDAAEAPHIDYDHAVQFQRLEPTLENALFRVAQEAITNACRHSRSKTVRIRLVQQGEQATLEVRDWGCGFDTESIAENRFGLEGIRERTRLLGGKLRIRSQPGKGTLIRLTFPVIVAK